MPDSSPTTPLTSPLTHARPVAVIGAGLAGLTLASGLQAAGYTVHLFDKSRGAGGRCATRRSPAGAFDHGAPVVQAHTAAFTKAVDDWAGKGWLAPVSEALGGPGWVGLPTMNAWLRQLSQGLRLHAERHIVALQHGADGWRLKCLDGSLVDEVFEAVLVALPAEQAAALLATAVVDAAALGHGGIASPGQQRGLLDGDGRLASGTAAGIEPLARQ